MPESITISPDDAKKIRDALSCPITWDLMKNPAITIPCDPEKIQFAQVYDQDAFEEHVAMQRQHGGDAHLCPMTRIDISDAVIPVRPLKAISECLHKYLADTEPRPPVPRFNRFMPVPSAHVSDACNALLNKIAVPLAVGIGVGIGFGSIALGAYYGSTIKELCNSARILKNDLYVIPGSGIMAGAWIARQVPGGEGTDALKIAKTIIFQSALNKVLITMFKEIKKNSYSGVSFDLESLAILVACLFSRANYNRYFLMTAGVAPMLGAVLLRSYTRRCRYLPSLIPLA